MSTAVLGGPFRGDTRSINDGIRARRKALQRAQTEIRLYTNDPTPKPGLVFRGKLNILDCVKHSWPMKKNVSASGGFTIRASHPLAKLILKIPNNPNECKNITVRVDRFGGKWRWTGLLHHWSIETRDGVDYLTASFNDDMQFPQFMLCPPNPALPIPLFQFPRDYFVFAPAAWGIQVTGFINLWRIEGHPFTLPDDPFDINQYDDIIDLNDWSVHIKGGTSSICSPIRVYGR